MSYILDALKRSEQERGRPPREPNANGTPVADPGEPAHHRRGWLAPALIAVLALNAALLGWYLLPGKQQPAAPTASTPPATMKPRPSMPAEQPASTPQPATAKPADKPRAPQPAERESTAAATEPDNTADETTSQKPPATQAVAAAAQTSPDVTETQATESPVQQAAPETTEPAPAQPEPTADTPPPLESMPGDIQVTAHQLQVNVHVFAEDPAARFVLINLKRFREGDRLPNGALLSAITPDGMILELNGYLFLMTIR